MSKPDHTPDRYESSPVELSKAGFSALKTGDIAAAVSYFRRILEYDSTNSYAFAGLAECERSQENLPAAAGWYEKCLEMDPENAVCLYGLVTCRSDMRQYEKIAGLWDRHSELMRSDDTVCLKTADAFRKLHNVDVAEALYLDLLDRDPRNRYALSGMGHLQYEKENYTESTKYWQRLLDIDQKSVIAHTCLGNSCRRLRNFEDGMKYYRRAAEIEPGNFYVLFGIADCARGLGDFDDALRYWQLLLEIEPQNRMILTRAGEACMRLSQENNARRYFEKALALGDDLFALVGMARLEREDGNPEKTYEYYKRVQSIDGAMKRFGDEINTFFDNYDVPKRT